jgi:hypothetical protein
MIASLQIDSDDIPPGLTEEPAKVAQSLNANIFQR